MTTNTNNPSYPTITDDPLQLLRYGKFDDTLLEQNWKLFMSLVHKLDHPNRLKNHKSKLKSANSVMNSRTTKMQHCILCDSTKSPFDCNRCKLPFAACGCVCPEINHIQYHHKYMCMDCMKIPTVRDLLFDQTIDGMRAIPKWLMFLRMAMSLMCHMDERGKHRDRLEKHLLNIFTTIKPLWNRGDNAKEVREQAMRSLHLSKPTVAFMFGVETDNYLVPSMKKGNEVISQKTAITDFFKTCVTNTFRALALHPKKKWSYQQVFFFLVKHLCNPSSFDPKTFLSQLDMIDPSLACAFIIFAKANRMKVNDEKNGMHIWNHDVEKRHLVYTNASMESFEKLDICMFYYTILLHCPSFGTDILSLYFNESILRIIKNAKPRGSKKKSKDPTVWHMQGKKSVNDSIASLTNALKELSGYTDADIPIQFVASLFNHAPYMHTVHEAVRMHNYRYAMTATKTLADHTFTARRLLTILQIHHTASVHCSEMYYDMALTEKLKLSLNLKKWDVIIHEKPGCELIKECMIIEDCKGSIPMFERTYKKMAKLLEQRPQIMQSLRENNISIVNKKPKKPVAPISALIEPGFDSMSPMSPMGSPAPIVSTLGAKPIFRKFPVAKRPSLHVATNDEMKLMIDVQKGIKKPAPILALPRAEVVRNKQHKHYTPHMDDVHTPKEPEEPEEPEDVYEDSDEEEDVHVTSNASKPHSRPSILDQLPVPTKRIRVR